MILSCPDIAVHWISLIYDILLDCGSLYILDLWYFTWSWLIANLIKIRSPHLLPVFYRLFYSRHVVLDISLDRGSLHILDLWYVTWLWFIGYPWPLTFHLIVVHWKFLTFDISLDCGSLHTPILWYFIWLWFIVYSWSLIFHLIVVNCQFN